MTDRDDSAKGFLERWSRKKIDAERETSAPAKADATDASPAAEVRLPEREAKNDTKNPDEATPKPEFDLASLPSLDSITAITDIRAFLTPGVPADIARAALRRAWAADPAIRDFKGLAENAWDFTDPAAMPGFGPLEATDEVRQMIAQVVRQIGQAAQPVESEAVSGHAEVAENSSDSNAIIPLTGVHNPATKQDEAGEETAQDLGKQVLLQSSTEGHAAQHDPAEAQEKPQQLSRRTHGGALPR